MRALRQVLDTIRVLTRARRNRLDLVRALARRPQLLIGTGVFELAMALSARVEPRLKVLAELKAAALVSCEYCLDIGSEIARDTGLREEQLRELPRYRTSDAFDDDERLVMELAEAMTLVPGCRRRRPEGPPGGSLHAKPSAAELASLIALENHRARLNQALGIRPSGFSDGQFCALPELVRELLTCGSRSGTPGGGRATPGGRPERLCPPRRSSGRRSSSSGTSPWAPCSTGWRRSTATDSS